MPNIKIQRTAEVMLSERIEILAAADLGVDLSAFLRLCGLRRIFARQTNCSLEPTPPASRTPFGRTAVRLSS